MKNYQNNGYQKVGRLEHLAKVIYSKAYRCLTAEDSRRIAAEVNIDMPHSVIVESNPIRFMERILLHNTEDLTSKGRTILGEIRYGEADMEGIISSSYVNPAKRAVCVVTRDSKQFSRIAEDILVYCPNCVR